jgi:hypothetical protein
MKTERLEEKLFTLLSKELQLDMPRPVAAKRKVVNEIIALIESSQSAPEEPRAGRGDCPVCNGFGYTAEHNPAILTLMENVQEVVLFRLNVKNVKRQDGSKSQVLILHRLKEMQSRQRICLKI